MEETAFPIKRLLGFLAQLEASAEDYLTLYVRLCSFPRHATELAVENSPMAVEVKEALATEAVLKGAERYGTGVVIFWSDSENKSIIIPPFPVPQDRVFKGRPETSILRHLLKKDRLLALVLVTWGSYAVGVLKGYELVESKAGTGHIHKRHRKGGSSQKRFARRTEEQKKDFLRRVADRVDERLKDYCPEQIFFGGNRLILKPLLGECPHLESEAQRISKRFLNVRKADREGLLRSVEDATRSLVFSY